MYKNIIKRILDIVVALLFLPVFILLILILAPIIYIEDKGAIFYNANRLGINGQTFKMYKFRTMKLNSPDIRNEDGSTFNAENDPRVTKIGNFMRKTSIDEIPQILNVIKGEMSFVGPRPDLPEHIYAYAGNEQKKLEVRPGITGYNQAFFRNSIEWKQRIANDVYYVENISFLFDLKIAIKTLSTILNKENIFILKK